MPLQQPLLLSCSLLFPFFVSCFFFFFFFFLSLAAQAPLACPAAASRPTNAPGAQGVACLARASPVVGHLLCVAAPEEPISPASVGQRATLALYIAISLDSSALFPASGFRCANVPRVDVDTLCRPSPDSTRRRRILSKDITALPSCLLHLPRRPLPRCPAGEGLRRRLHLPREAVASPQNPQETESVAPPLLRLRIIFPSSRDVHRL